MTKLRDVKDFQDLAHIPNVNEQLSRDLFGGLGPGEWVGAVVPAVDVGADLGTVAS